MQHTSDLALDPVIRLITYLYPSLPLSSLGTNQLRLITTFVKHHQPQLRPQYPPTMNCRQQAGDEQVGGFLQRDGNHLQRLCFRRPNLQPEF